jgi:hypothetical protein
MLLVYSTVRSSDLLRAALGTLRKAPHGLPRQRREAAPDRRAPGKLSSVSGLNLLVCEAFSYWCIRPSATSVSDLKLLVFAAFSYSCMRPYATSVSDLGLLVYEALRY